MKSAASQSIPVEKLSRLEHLLDRQDILDCLIRFSRGIDRFDRELFLSAFHSDAIIAAGSYVGGPAGLYDWASGLHDQGQSATHHNLLNHSCEIEGTMAHTETYYLFVGRNRDNTNWAAGTNSIEWSGIVPTTEIPFADVPDIHVNGSSSRSKADPSYARPLTNKREMHTPSSSLA